MCHLFYYLSIILIVIVNNSIELHLPRSETNDQKDIIENRSQWKLLIEEEIEWLLDQLIRTMSKFVLEVEMDPTLLGNLTFRRILVRILVRITDIIEQIEKMPKISSSMSKTINKLDSVRVRLSNFVGVYVHENNNKDYSNKKVTISTTTEGIKMGVNELMSIISEIMAKLQAINSFNQNKEKSKF
jgi:hypothetical protein